MKAMVRFADGSKAVCTITNIENDGSGEYGYARRNGKKIPVSQSTTVHHSDRSVTKEWDEIVQRAPAPLPVEEDW